MLVKLMKGLSVHSLQAQQQYHHVTSSSTDSFCYFRSVSWRGYIALSI